MASAAKRIASLNPKVNFLKMQRAPCGKASFIAAIKIPKLLIFRIHLSFYHFLRFVLCVLRLRVCDLLFGEEYFLVTFPTFPAQRCSLCLGRNFLPLSFRSAACLARVCFFRNFWLSRCREPPCEYHSQGLSILVKKKTTHNSAQITRVSFSLLPRCPLSVCVLPKLRH